MPRKGGALIRVAHQECLDRLTQCRVLMRERGRTLTAYKAGYGESAGAEMFAKDVADLALCIGAARRWEEGMNTAPIKKEDVAAAILFTESNE